MSDTGVLVLVFLAGGQVELQEDDELVWSSDDCDEWQAEHDGAFLNASDAPEVLNFLVDEGWLEQSEKSQVAIEVEAHTAESILEEGEDETATVGAH